MSDAMQQWLSLGLGGGLIGLVGYSVWKLIGGWMSLASTERDSSAESKVRADTLQDKLNKEIALRVALEVEVKYLRMEIDELRRHVDKLERKLEDDER